MFFFPVPSLTWDCLPLPTLHFFQEPDTFFLLPHLKFVLTASFLSHLSLYSPFSLKTLKYICSLRSTFSSSDFIWLLLPHLSIEPLNALYILHHGSGWVSQHPLSASGCAPNCFGQARHGCQCQRSFCWTMSWKSSCTEMHTDRKIQHREKNTAC